MLTKTVPIIFRKDSDLRLIKGMCDALAWYVAEDDVSESMPGNEYWVEGKRNAERLIAAADEVLSVEEQ